MGTILFYFFSFAMVMSAVIVISARNPVYSVLFLILSFVNAAVLFLLAGAEFLSMILILVYVGAVAVLFLFVVMMLDIDFTNLKYPLGHYWILASALGGSLLLELMFVIWNWQETPQTLERLRERAGGDLPMEIKETAEFVITAPLSASNTAALGRVLYTEYFYFFQIAGLILLSAMVGAITLTVKHRISIKRQKISEQNARTLKDVIEIRKVPFRSGLS